MKSGSGAMRTGPSGERLGLGERLQAARKRRGLTQLAAAREIGICRETLARIEVDHIPSEETRAKVLRWLAEQEAAAAVEAAAAAKAEGAEGRERRAAAERIGAARWRQLARLARRRRFARLVAAGKPGR